MDPKDTSQTSAKQIHNLTRRAFLGGAAATAFTIAGTRWPLSSVAAVSPSGTSLADGVWLGPELWGNRLQDWVRANGRLECVAPAGQRRTRTISWLTREIGWGSVHLRTRTGVLNPGAGFSGFLIGTGVPGEDWRRRALVGSASGTGGGLLATYEADGQVRFREHTDESEQFAFAELPSTVLSSGAPRTTGEDVTLHLDVTPDGRGTVRLVLRALDTMSGAQLSSAELDRVPAAQVQGGVHLVSSALEGSGSTFWLTDPTGEGSGLDCRPERSFGPVVGTLFSINGSTLKLAAQLMPVNTDAIPGATLQVSTGWDWPDLASSGNRRDPFGGRHHDHRGGWHHGHDGGHHGDHGWQDVASEPVGAGYAVQFRVEGWDTRRAQRYRVVTADGSTFEGTVPCEPTDGLSIAMINCTKASSRQLDTASAAMPKLPGSHQLDLYSVENLYFPHEQLAANIAEQRPDLVVAHGDQLYETSPTVKDNSGAPELDWLYKYYLWLWAFGDLTRNVPTIVLVDDHDVYQGNIWGEGGVPAPGRDINKGGYANDPTWVNTIQRAAVGHDPDPFDPTPVAQGINVYYCAFTYGGVNFAVIEDRKFKTGPDGLGPDEKPLPEDQLQLLGQRQEDFLAAWAETEPDLPRILLTQTAWSCVQTNPEGKPNSDRDTGGWPKPARDRALELVRQAGALMLSGDQHLGSLVRQGIEEATDGPVQFTSPAGSSEFQRWFEPATPLPNAGSTPNTGDFTDGFGNEFRALALVNPSFSYAEYRSYYAKGQGFGDRALKNEGYGIVRIEPRHRRVSLECWRWDTPPSSGGQYPGFPQTFGFDELGESRAAKGGGRGPRYQPAGGGPGYEPAGGGSRGG